MKQPKYDIFIGYRRLGGSQYARMICLLLRERGYRVFQDIDCLIETNFNEQLKVALKNSELYMVILSNGSLVSRYVVNGILKAYELNKPIIPIVCDNQDPIGGEDVIPNSKEAYEIKKKLQWSKPSFGLTLKNSFDIMEKTIVRKYTTPNLFKGLLYKIRGSMLNF